MNERAQRVVLLVFVLTLYAIQWKSHGALPGEVPMAFVRYTTVGVTVRIQGELNQPGIYKFPDGEILMTAINMTAPKVISGYADIATLQQKIQNGSDVHIRRDRHKSAEITLSKLKITDRVLLGIPLHPDQLSFSEWDSLPGIGPSLAEAIINDRQVNGAFGSLRGVQRVSGVGEKKVLELISLF